MVATGISTATRGKTGKQKAAEAKAGPNGKAPVAAKPMAQPSRPKARRKKAKAFVPAPVINAKALSVDVGPRVIAGFMENASKEAEANKLLSGIASKRYDLLQQLTMGVYKAAKADKSINLAAYFSGDNKLVNAENDKLGIALGFRKVVTAGEGDKARERVVLHPDVAKLFPGAEVKDTPEYKRRATVISNFLHSLKKCAQAAEGIIQKDIKATIDKSSGTLKLSGPEIKTTFGEDSVLLNEKQTLGEGDKKKKLLAKPSYTAIADIGARAHNKVMKVRKDSRAGAVDPVLAFVTVCDQLVIAIGKLGDKPDDKQVKALANVQNAIEQSGLV
jgi:hypothetical protein